MGIAFADAQDRLDHETLELFCEMVEAHLAAASGDRLFLRADSMGGCALIFSTRAHRQEWEGFNGGSLDDLCSYGLLHRGYGSRGTPNYRISADGTAFYRWLRQQQGTAIDQTERAVLRLVGAADYATRHPGAAHHLAEAFDLLRSDRAGQQVTSEIGDHLRKAIMDTVADLLGKDNQEQPVQQLEQWLAGRGSLHRRERDGLAALIELTRAVLRLDHRLNHVRDEASKGEPEPTHEEIRRAAFLTAVTCHELDRIERHKR